MDPSQWVSRCADQLRRQWPMLVREDLEDTARELYNVEPWRSMRPEAAAVEWLKLGVLASD